jgi:hypothetical protein
MAHRFSAGDLPPRAIRPHGQSRSGLPAKRRSTTTRRPPGATDASIACTTVDRCAGEPRGVEGPVAPGLRQQIQRKTGAGRRRPSSRSSASSSLAPAADRGLMLVKDSSRVRFPSSRALVR